MTKGFYNPVSEDFHIGFEYEQLEGKQKTLWTNEIYNGGIHPTELLKKETIRVKYIDLQDIDSLGWKLVNQYSNTHILTEDFEIQHYDHPWKWHLQLILPINEYFWSENIAIYFTNGIIEDVKFDGTIKNKSELKILMNQLMIKGSVV